LVDVELENLRGRAVKLAAAAHGLKCFANISAPFSLAFLTDRMRIPHPETITRALPKGAAIILRDYDWPEREALARRLKVICVERRLLLLIGADIELAKTVGADGVHFPSRMKSRLPLPATMIMSTACHTQEDLDRAGETHTDIAFLSPVYPTASHPGAQSLGPDTFKAMARGATVPVIALGGVDEENADMLNGPNIVGLAAIGAFLPG